MQKLEMFLHLVLGFRMLSFVDALGDVEDEEESYCEDDTGDGGNALGEKIDDGRREQHQMNRGQTERNLNTEILGGNRWWHLPAALAGEFEAQHQHRQAVEGEAPDHAERIRFAQGVDI